MRKQVIRRGTARATGMNHSQTMKSIKAEQKENMTQDLTGPGIESLTF